jgi:hypothetical protein
VDAPLVSCLKRGELSISSSRLRCSPRGDVRIRTRADTPRWLPACDVGGQLSLTAPALTITAPALTREGPLLLLPLRPKRRRALSRPFSPPAGTQSTPSDLSPRVGWWRRQRVKLVQLLDKPWVDTPSRTHADGVRRELSLQLMLKQRAGDDGERVRACWCERQRNQLRSWTCWRGVRRQVCVLVSGSVC